MNPEAGELDPLDEFFVDEEERESQATSYGTTETYSETALEFLAFWVGDEEYAIDIREIQELIKVPAITRVPRVSEAVLGIVSLRGVIVPVVDMRQVLGLRADSASRKARILVLRGGGEPIGILVDRVTSVVRFEQGALESTPEAMKRDSSDLLRGVGRVGEQMVIVLDVEALLSTLDSVR